MHHESQNWLTRALEYATRVAVSQRQQRHSITQAQAIQTKISDAVSDLFRVRLTVELLTGLGRQRRSSGFPRTNPLHRPLPATASKSHQIGSSYVARHLIRLRDKRRDDLRTSIMRFLALRLTHPFDRLEIL